MNCNRISVRLYTVLFLGFIAIIIGLRTYNHAFVWDEVAYQHVFIDPDTGSDWWFDTDRPISSLDDVVESQINHYKFANGRTLVHFYEQIFSENMVPFWTFCVVNALMFVLFLGLLVKLIGPNPRSKIPLCLILSSILLLYIFPEYYQLWTSINYSPNYLFPSLLLCLVLIALDWINRAAHLSLALKISFIVISFICGWSNEAVSLPLSGALTIMVLIEYYKNKKINKTRFFFVITPVWLGTIVLLLSPGNWIRLAGQQNGSSLASTILNFLNFIVEVRMFWMLLALLTLIKVISHFSLIKFIKDNKLLFTITFFSLLLTFIAHTTSRSLIGGEVCCLILFMKLIMNFIVPKCSKTLIIVITSLATLCVVIHQSMVAFDTIEYHKQEKRLIKEFINSSDGVVLFEEMELNPLTKPFVRRLDETSGIGDYGVMSTLKIWSGRNDCDFILLRHGDYEAIKDKESFYTSKNRTSFTAPIYYASGNWMWIHPDSVPAVKTVIVEYKNDFIGEKAPLLIGLKFKYSPNSVPKTDECKIDKVITDNGVFYRIPLHEYLKFKDVRFSK